jgi:hypothetical protein
VEVEEARYFVDNQRVEDNLVDLANLVVQHDFHALAYIEVLGSLLVLAAEDFHLVHSLEIEHEAHIVANTEIGEDMDHVCYMLRAVSYEEDNLAYVGLVEELLDSSFALLYFLVNPD